jgi:hypothetical protein
MSDTIHVLFVEHQSAEHNLTLFRTNTQAMTAYTAKNDSTNSSAAFPPATSLTYCHSSSTVNTVQISFSRNVQSQNEFLRPTEASTPHSDHAVILSTKEIIEMLEAALKIDVCFDEDSTEEEEQPW